MAQPCVYMLANKYRGTLQIGVTANLQELMAAKRQEQQMVDDPAQFVAVLVWSENHAQLSSARVRCEELQRMSRDFKIGLIERKNPSWRDLYVPLPRHSHKPTLRRLPLSARQFL